MVYYKKFLTWLCLLCTVPLTVAIYEEQLGEYDWKSENIGAIQQSVFYRDEVFVASEHGVIACLRSKSAGAWKWRVVLPIDSEVVKIAIVKKTLVSVTKQCTYSASAASSVSCLSQVRAWSMLDGSLQWDVSLGRFVADIGRTDEEPTFPTELEYDSKHNVVSVLSNNALYFITPTTTSSAQQLASVWSWPAEQDMVISHLIVATHVDETADKKTETGGKKSGFVRVAAGCYTSSSSSSLPTGVCSELFVAKVSHSDSDVQVDKFSGFSANVAVQPSSIRALVSSDESLGASKYHVQDILFASSARLAYADDHEEEEERERVVSAAAGNNVMLVIKSLDTSATESASDVLSVRSPTAAVGLVTFLDAFVHTAGDGTLHPAVAYCFRSLEQQECHAVAAFPPPPNGRGDSSPVQWEIVELLGEVSACTSFAPFTSSLQATAMTIQRHPLHNSVATDVHCILGEWREEDGPQLTLAKVQVASASDPSKELSFTAFSSLMPQPHHTSSSSFPSLTQQDMSVLLPHWTVSSSSPSFSPLSSTVLIVTDRTGCTVALRHDTKEKKEEVLFSRVEHLSRVQHASLLNAVPSAAREEARDVSGSSGSADDIDSQVEASLLLSPASRWRHQKHLLKARLTDAFSLFSSSSPPSSSAAPAAGGGGVMETLLASIKAGSSSRSESKMELFGFDKVVVTLSYKPHLFRSLESDSSTASNSTERQQQQGQGGVSFGEAGFVLSAYNLMSSIDNADSADRGDSNDGFFTPKWHAVLATKSSPASSGAVVCTVKLLSLSTSSLHPIATVVVGLTTGETFVWHIDVNTGLDISSSSSSSGGGRNCSATGTCDNSGSSTRRSRVVAAHSTVSSSRGAVSDVVMMRSYDGEDRETGGAGGGGGMTYHTALLVHQGGSVGTIVHVPHHYHHHTLASISSTPEHFVHTIDATTGGMHVYKATGACPISSTAGSEQQLPCLSLTEVASASLTGSNGGGGTIAAVAHRSATDTIHTRTSVLGDDSVLLKYLNPNVVLVAVLEPAEGGSADAAALSVEPENLVVYLLDTVSARVIKKVQHGPAAAPVRAVLVENYMAVTYWNPRAMRSELSVTALLEGAIDRKGMGPLMGLGLTSKPLPLPESPPSGTKRHVLSNFGASAAVPPLAMQKSFVLPRQVLSLEHTISAAGVTNKNLLMQFANGQIYSVDMRQVHPRRPLEEPSQSEKEEGLHRYNAFLSMIPFNAVTLDYTLHLGAVTRSPRLLSAPSRLESSSVLLSFGGLDVHVGRVMPSGGFDLLASDFNHALLLMVLGGLSLGVFLLRRAHKKKQLATLWR